MSMSVLSLEDAWFLIYGSDGIRYERSSLAASHICSVPYMVRRHERSQWVSGNNIHQEINLFWYREGKLCSIGDLCVEITGRNCNWAFEVKGPDSQSCQTCIKSNLKTGTFVQILCINLLLGTLKTQTLLMPEQMCDGSFLSRQTGNKN